MSSNDRANFLNYVGNVPGIELILTRDEVVISIRVQNGALIAELFRLLRLLATNEIDFGRAANTVNVWNVALYYQDNYYQSGDLGFDNLLMLLRIFIGLRGNADLSAENLGQLLRAILRRDDSGVYGSGEGDRLVNIIPALRSANYFLILRGRLAPPADRDSLRMLQVDSLPCASGDYGWMSNKECDMLINDGKIIEPPVICGQTKHGIKLLHKTKVNTFVNKKKFNRNSNLRYASIFSQFKVLSFKHTKSTTRNSTRQQSLQILLDRLSSVIKDKRFKKLISKFL